MNSRFPAPLDERAGPEGLRVGGSDGAAVRLRLAHEAVERTPGAVVVRGAESAVRRVEARDEALVVRNRRLRERAVALCSKTDRIVCFNKYLQNYRLFD